MEVLYKSFGFPGFWPSPSIFSSCLQFFTYSIFCSFFLLFFLSAPPSAFPTSALIVSFFSFFSSFYPFIFFPSSVFFDLFSLISSPYSIPPLFPLSHFLVFLFFFHTVYIQTPLSLVYRKDPGIKA